MNTGLLSLLVATQSVYLVQIGIVAPAYFAGLAIFVVSLPHLKRLRIDSGRGLFLSGLLALILLILINSGGLTATTSAFITNLSLSLTTAISLFSTCRKHDVKHLASLVFALFVAIAVLDTLYKAMIPIVIDPEMLNEREFFEIGFYQYKGSFLYKDSNGLAFLLLPIMALGFEIHRASSRRGGFSWISLYYLATPALLICTTMSRAGIVAAVLLLVLYTTEKAASAASISVAIIALYRIYMSYFANDLSAGTKFDEFTDTMSFLRDSNLPELLFGIGFGNGEAISGRYLHGSLQKITIELGLTGVLAYGLTMFGLCALGGTWRAVAGVFFMSLSSNFYFLPPFSVAVQILCHYVNSLAGTNAALPLLRNARHE